MDILSCIVEIITFILDLRVILGAVTTFIIIGLFILRKEFRLFMNLRKEIYFLKTNLTQNPDSEIERLKSNGFFKIHDTPIDLSQNIRNLQTKKNAILVILYSSKFSAKSYEKILDYSQANKIPLICYSKGKIIKAHDKMFKEHPYVDICNTPTRLVSTIFSIAAVTPYEKG